MPDVEGAAGRGRDRGWVGPPSQEGLKSIPTLRRITQKEHRPEVRADVAGPVNPRRQGEFIRDVHRVVIVFCRQPLLGRGRRMKSTIVRTIFVMRVPAGAVVVLVVVLGRRCARVEVGTNLVIDRLVAVVPVADRR